MSPIPLHTGAQPLPLLRKVEGPHSRYVDRYECHTWLFVQRPLVSIVGMKDHWQPLSHTGGDAQRAVARGCSLIPVPRCVSRLWDTQIDLLAEERQLGEENQ